MQQSGTIVRKDYSLIGRMIFHHTTYSCPQYVHATRTLFSRTAPNIQCKTDELKVYVRLFILLYSEKLELLLLSRFTSLVFSPKDCKAAHMAISIYFIPHQKNPFYMVFFVFIYCRCLMLNGGSALDLLFDFMVYFSQSHIV